MKLKVCIIEPVGGHGGMDYYDSGLCGGLSIAGVDVVLHTSDFLTKNGVNNFDVRPSFRGVYRGKSKLKKGFLFLKGSLVSLISAVLESRKIVHFHLFNVGVTSAFNIFLAKLLLRKIVITAHDVESFVSEVEMPLLSKVVYRLADRVIAHNVISKTELLRCMKIPESKIKIISSGNYIEIAKGAPSREVSRGLLNINPTSKVILFFGQIKEVKGLELLLKALPGVIKAHPEATLLIAGRPWKTTFSKYQKLIDELAISEACIIHLRFIPDNELPWYYAASDIVALPYKRIYQSAVVLMAMSFGRAVIVSDLPGMMEIVSAPHVGRVFESGNSKALEDQLISALADNATRTDHARNGLLHMKEKYSWELIGVSTSELYSEILSR